jgi:hypothetical protein
MAARRKPKSLPHYELKSALQSKKFIAYLVADIGWKILLAMLIYLQRDGLESFALMLSIVVVAGFVQVGFILGQASLDRFVRVAEIASRSVKIEDE